MLKIPDIVSRFDYEDDSVTADVIELSLLGDLSYRDRFRSQAGEAISDFYVELRILQWYEREKVYGEKHPFSGDEWHQHFLRYLKLLLPGTGDGEFSPFVVHPWSMERACGLQYVLSNGLDFQNWIGAKSSGKSYECMACNIGLMLISPEYSVCYVAAPFKNAASSTVWGDIVTHWKHAKAVHHDYGVLRNSKELGGRESYKIILSDRHEKSGYIELRGLDQIGKFKGSKATNQYKGYFMLNADEINEWKSDSWLWIVDNTSSNENFLGWTMCNFKDQEGVEGVMCRPRGKEFASLDPDIDQYWESEYNSITLRSDGYRNPNVLANKKHFKKLDAGLDVKDYKFKNIYRNGLLSYRKFVSHFRNKKKGSASYWEQLRSHPMNALDTKRILRRDDFRAGNSYEEIVYNQGVRPVVVGFLDPNRGGDDEAPLTLMEFGTAQVMGSKGNYENMDILQAQYVYNITVSPTLIANERYIAWANKLTNQNLRIVEGKLVDVDLQTALMSLSYLKKHSVDPRNFGFDDSLRGAIGSRIREIMGNEVEVFEFGRDPRQHKLNKNRDMSHLTDADGRKMVDKYRDTQTMMAFAFANIVTNGQYRKAQVTEKANQQFCRQFWDDKGDRTKKENKKEYRKNNSGNSPDCADSAGGCALMALLRGFKFHNSSINGSGRYSYGKKVIDLAKEIPFFKRSNLPRI